MSGQVAPEGQQGQGNQFEMLFGKGDADDGDGENQSRYQMDDHDLPSEKDGPDDVEQQVDAAPGVAGFNDRFAKGREGGNAEFDRLHTEGDADDGEAEQQPAQDVTQTSEKAAEDKPNDIAETGQGEAPGVRE